MPSESHLSHQPTGGIGWTRADSNTERDVCREDASAGANLSPQRLRTLLVSQPPPPGSILRPFSAALSPGELIPARSANLSRFHLGPINERQTGGSRCRKGDSGTFVPPPPWLASGWPQPFHPAHISADNPFMKPPSFNHQDGFYFQPDTRALFQNLFLNSGVPGDRASRPVCVEALQTTAGSFGADVSG